PTPDAISRSLGAQPLAAAYSPMNWRISRCRWVSTWALPGRVGDSAAFIIGASASVILPGLRRRCHVHQSPGSLPPLPMTLNSYRPAGYGPSRRIIRQTTRPDCAVGPHTVLPGQTKSDLAWPMLQLYKTADPDQGAELARPLPSSAVRRGSLYVL